MRTRFLVLAFATLLAASARAETVRFGDQPAFVVTVPDGWTQDGPRGGFAVWSPDYKLGITMTVLPTDGSLDHMADMSMARGGVPGVTHRVGPAALGPYRGFAYDSETIGKNGIHGYFRFVLVTIDDKRTAAAGLVSFYPPSDPGFAGGLEVLKTLSLDPK